MSLIEPLIPNDSVPLAVSNVKKRVRSGLQLTGGYENAPESLQAWIVDSSDTSMSFSTEAGRRMADYNVKRVATAEVRPSDYGFVAVEVPDGDEARDMDFMASSNVLFFEFLGKPGTVAYVQCLGCLSLDQEGSALSGRRFTVAPSTHFLLASGDFAVCAQKLKASEGDNGKASSEAPMDKKSASRAQEAGGERSEGEKGGNYFIVTRDGVRLPTRDKSNLQVRCDNLEFMRRAADKNLWKHMAGSGYKLQADVYWKIILEEAEVLQQPAESAFQRAGKVYLMSGTGIAKNPKMLELFLRGEFGEGDLTLDSFCAGARLTTTAFPCILQNAPLVGAIEALAVALEVLFSHKFAGACDDLIEALRGHVRPLRLTDSGFLIHTVERVFIKFFRIVSKEDKALETPDSDITNPTGCANLLKAMLGEMVRELVDVAKATVLEKRYTVLMRLRKDRTVPKAKAVGGVREQSGDRLSIDQCGSHLGQLLKATKKNGAPLKCAKGSECRYLHGKLSEMTKASAVQLVATMPEWLKECLTPLVAACKSFKL